MGQCLGRLDSGRQAQQSQHAVNFTSVSSRPPVPERTYVTDPTRSPTQAEQATVPNVENQGSPKRFLVAAIDLGTTFSGYAFSFRHEFLSDKLRISTNLWPHNNGMSMKAPTSILLDPDGEVKAFGYEAIKTFGDLAEYNQHVDHYIFNKFKMNLYQQGGLSTDFKLHDISGKTMLAVDVFAKVIWYLKQHLLERVRGMDSKIQLNPDDVHWVVTVPAIWDDKAKFFMRKAAEKAGIEGRNLTLALEPEAASMYCRYIQTFRTDAHGTDQAFDFFRPKTKYMVVDLGGGTVDITVHSVLESGALEEVYQPTGGYWGGSTVDNEFCALLVLVFGNDVYQEFQEKFTADVIDLYQEFDLKKRTFEPGKETPLSIKLPASLVELYKLRSGEEDIQEVLKTKFDQEIKVKRDKLQISPQVFIRLFNNSISNIVSHIQSLLEKNVVSGVSVILLVGGYAECYVVRDAIVSHFPNLQIIHPPDSGSTVLKGAVLFGHDPKAITARVCKYTYGIAMMVPYKEGVCDPSKKLVINGVEVCDDVFDVHMRVGEQVSLTDKRTGKEYNVLNGQSHSLLDVYASSVPNPKYVTENWCTRLGSIVLELPSDTRPDDKIVVFLYYNGTELGVSAFNPRTKEETITYFDFLG